MAPIKSLPFLSSNRNENSKKASKPLIEKRRRARINYSLAELKSIIVDSDKGPNVPAARPPKLEKADILEMTVAYVKRMHCKSQTQTPDSDRDYVEGYDFCLNLVHRFLDHDPDSQFKTRLLNHLSCHRPPSSIQPPLEQPSSTIDDSSSSYSSNSRSQTPSSMIMDTSSSPYTDSEHEASSSLLMMRTEKVKLDRLTPPYEQRTKVHEVKLDRLTPPYEPQQSSMRTEKVKIDRLTPPYELQQSSIRTNQVKLDRLTPSYEPQQSQGNSGPLNLVSRAEAYRSVPQQRLIDNVPDRERWANYQYQPSRNDYPIQRYNDNFMPQDGPGQNVDYYGDNGEPWRPW